MSRISLKITIVGIAPSEVGRNWDPRALSTQNLAELADLPPERLRDFFTLHNLCEEPMPSREELKIAASHYVLSRERAYILCGSDVVRAFGKRVRPDLDLGAVLPWYGNGPNPCEWYTSRDGVRMAILPHPSGRNRWYEHPGCRRAAEIFMTNAVQTAREQRRKRA